MIFFVSGLRGLLDLLFPRLEGQAAAFGQNGRILIKHRVGCLCLPQRGAGVRPL